MDDAIPRFVLSNTIKNIRTDKEIRELIEKIKPIKC